MPVFMLLVAVIVPFRDIAPAYAGPQMITEQQLPSDLQRLEVDYGDQLRLVGYRLAEPLARSDSVEFTLYWQCLQPIDADYSIFIIVYGRQLQEIGKRDAYPYHGLFATHQCQPGQIFADPYHVPIRAAGAQRPAVLRAQIGLKDWTTGDELTPNAGAAVMLAAGKLASTEQPADNQSLNYRVGENLTLRAARLERGDSGPVLSLTWQAAAAPQEDYMTFVHVLDAGGQLIGQADGPPLGGDYPTAWWSPGETIVDARSLSLPPEADRVTIGLYRLRDETRLPIVDDTGQRVPNDEIVLPVGP
jgi:hypothetical protein